VVLILAGFSGAERRGNSLIEKGARFELAKNRHFNLREAWAEMAIRCGDARCAPLHGLSSYIQN
jgi:hypothetical protein